MIRRLQGGPVELPEEGNWPVLEGVSEEDWRGLLRSFNDRHERLLAIVTGLPEARFCERMGEVRDQAMATGVTIAASLNGLSQHTIYHVGQITLMKKLALG